jgi:beta-lactamase regulating signal transducer with metallopeptidase domain
VPTIFDTLAAIVLTYAAHSAVACGIALAIARCIRRPHDRDVLWKAALVAPIVTTATATVAGNFGLRALVDLANVVRRWVHVPLPHRTFLVRMEHNASGSNVFRQFTDPVTTTLTTIALIVAAVAVVLALVRFIIRRHALTNALGKREHIADVPSSNGSTIRLFATDGLQSPVAFGANEICLPTEVLNGFTGDHQQSLIAHETAHLERRDPPWFLAVELITALSAFQPLVFVVARAFRRDVELICDEAAVTKTGDRGAMIGALARLAAPFDASAALHAATAYDGSPLVERAERIATLAPMAAPVRKRSGWVYAAAIVAATPLAIPVLSSAPRLPDFPGDVPALFREAHALGRGVRIDTTMVGDERIVRRMIVRVN